LERSIDGVTIECFIGDIARQVGFDAIVNAANADLLPGGGVSGTIHQAAGPELAAECRSLAPIKPGHAVITGGHGLPNRYVIHCLGPVYGVDEPSAALLGGCYRNALRLADELELVSVAFPAISTGVFGYPMDEAAEVALAAVAAAAGSLKSVRVVRFVLRNPAALRAHERALEDEWTRY
jgi:O-acetyl-ADP-ribose deacetylase (regulator of RNase III)